MLQHALRGHGFKLEMSSPDLGAFVSGTCGPHIALAIGSGNGGSPSLTQSLTPGHKAPHPFQP